MKKLVLSFLMAGMAIFCFGQSGLVIDITNIETGTNLKTNQALMAKVYTFHMPVYKTNPSVVNNSFTVQLRKMAGNGKSWGNAGEIIVLNPEDGQSKWRKKVKYAGTRYVQQDDVLFEQKAGKLSRLNIENGSTIWKNKNTVYQIYPEVNRALCYDYRATGMGVLHGLDLINGQSIWTRQVPSQFGWEKTDILDDSTLLINSSGLHLLQLKSGMGWDMTRVSNGKKVSAGKIGLTALAAASMAIGGVGMVPNDLSDMYLGISSNILYDKDMLFFAAKNKISCRSMSGENLWDHDLNEKLTSKSHLFRDGNLIYMVNMGYALKYGRPASFGTPFVAVFDAATGEQVSLKVWEDRKNYIVDYMVQRNEICLLYQDKVEIFNLTSEGLSEKTEIRMLENVKMHSFVSDQLYCKKDSFFTRLSLDKEHYYIFSQDMGLYQYDNNFQFVEKMDIKTVYRNYGETDKFFFLGNDRETFVTDIITNIPEAVYNIPLNSMRFGSKLYGIDKNKVSEVDIIGFLESKADE